MSRSTFNHYNLTKHNASKKTFNVSQFYGVEYKRSQLETKDYHATDIKNIVYKDKTNQKRSGYEQVAKAPYNVNGYYEFYDESGSFHQIMHIGTGLYEVTNLEKNSNYWETKFNLISSNMANHKSMAFSSKGILYILDGTKYRYLRLNSNSLELNNVVGSDIVYIPITSLLNSDGTITAYDDVNILTIWRKNTIEGVVYTEDATVNKTYTLDSPLEYSYVDSVVLTINNKNYYPHLESTDQDELGYNVYTYFFYNDLTQTNNISNSVAIMRVWQNYRFNSTINIANSHNTIRDSSNKIFIKFVPHNYNSNNANTINNCTFGTVYNDRLFVSGNSNYKNTDWHTQPITNYENDETYGDFTYFSDLDYCNYGSDNTSVVGYDIFSDGNLIVFKEPSRFEPTIYRRYKELKVATSYTGEEVSTQKENETYYEEGYPCFPINTMGGEGGIKNRSIANFLGNTLVLTKSGLKKLFTRQNTYNSERILVDVSSNINLAILEENLNNAFLFTFKDRLIMKVGDYVYLAYGSLKEDNEYEWYKLEGIKADIFFEIDNELYFSDIDGNICRFNDGEYVFKDRDRYYLEEGDALPENNTITVNTELDEDDYALPIEHFADETERPMYYKLGTIANASDPNNMGYVQNVDGKSQLIITNENLSLEDGIEIYLDGDNVTDDYILEDTKNAYPSIYYLKYKNDGSYALLEDLVTSDVWVSSENMQLSIKKVENEENTYELVDGQGNSVEFYTGSAAQSYYLIITHDRNVECYYITKPYDMGSIGYDKTIWQYSIANDTNLESVTDLGYLANRKQGTAAFAKGNKGLRFDEYNFGTISFLNDGLPHIYTKYRVIPSVNFIRFTFRNLEETNMALSQLSFVYTISGQVRGSK